MRDPSPHAPRHARLCAPPTRRTASSAGVAAGWIGGGSLQISARANAYTDLGAVKSYALLKAVETTGSRGVLHDQIMEKRAATKFAYGAIGRAAVPILYPAEELDVKHVFPCKG